MRRWGWALVLAVVLTSVLLLACILPPREGRPVALVEVGMPETAGVALGSDPNVEALLAVNAQASALAGYPALVEVGRRRAAAEQAAEGLRALEAEVEALPSPQALAGQQAEILRELARGLAAYAAGEGSAGAIAASKANAELRALLLEIASESE